MILPHRSIGAVFPFWNKRLPSPARRDFSPPSPHDCGEKHAPAAENKNAPHTFTQATKPV
ncbi:hypothetical protein [Crenobacter luteus]|uniref:hypothetical protein n=1 Tax=Crenobacter luteus TaxID=1452487 RepID=UPI0012E9759F|nr:hypothetical protein [Crenobacter luteus]